jgi:AcrR family transcriptional regulator
MFLEHGFDAVRVADVAVACGVSEKTVYNYFPTKESLILDREDAMVDAMQRALGPGGPPGSPIDATLTVLLADMDRLCDRAREDEAFDPAVITRFVELVEGTPSLRAAQRDMSDRVAQVSAEAMAARAGMDPDDPEPQIAADAILGLWHVQFRSMRKHADGVRTVGELRDAVVTDLQRAARLIDTGLWSFGMAVQGRNTREQLRVAAEASNEARKQVVTAMRQAREAWRTVVAEAQAHGAAGDATAARGAAARAGMERHRLAHDLQQAQREVRKAQWAEQKAQREAQKAQREEQKAQREELKAQREAAKRLREDLKAQREAMKADRERLKDRRPR